MVSIMYPNVNPQELEPFYSQHVQAMTNERLHSKADIAAQLAVRDMKLIQQRVSAITTPRPDYVKIALSILDTLEEIDDESTRTQKAVMVADILSKTL